MPLLKDRDFPDLLNAEVMMDDGFVRIGMTYRFDAEELKRFLLSIDTSQQKRYILTHYFAPEDALRVGRMTTLVDFLYEPQDSAPLKIGMSYFTPSMIEQLIAWLQTQT
ncbi:hypothetical protein IT407_02490 [Candidatus Uhrbacteria bacterium]|nr:hypothetical protein [Candidatus Uhrbacteria bacterium]